MAKQKLTIIYGLNASGKTKFYEDEIKSNSVMGISTDEIKSSEGENVKVFEFKYKEKELKLLEESFTTKIIKNIELAIEKEDLKGIKEFKNPLKVYESITKSFPFLGSLYVFSKETVSKTVHDEGKMTLVGAVTLDKSASKLRSESGSSSETIQLAFKKVVIDKINKGLDGWEKVAESVGINITKIDPIDCDENWGKFFSALTQASLKKMTAESVIGSTLMYHTNWEQFIIDSLFSDSVDVMNDLKDKYIKLQEDIKLNENAVTKLFKVMLGKILEDSNEIKIEGKIVKSDKPFSNGQITSLKMTALFSEAIEKEETIIFDDTTESLDAGNKDAIINAAVSVPADISFLTHQIIDVEGHKDLGVSVKYQYIDMDGNINEGSPIMRSSLSKFSNPSGDLEHVMAISSRILNRGIADYAHHYGANKSYSASTHSRVLYNKLSDLIHDRPGDYQKYFAQSRNYIKSLNPKSPKDLCKKMIDVLDKELPRRTVIKKTSIKYVLDFWESLLKRMEGIESTTIDSFIHSLDLVIKIKDKKVLIDHIKSLSE